MLKISQSSADHSISDDDDDDESDSDSGSNSNSKSESNDDDVYEDELKNLKDDNLAEENAKSSDLSLVKKPDDIPVTSTADDSKPNITFDVEEGEVSSGEDNNSDSTASSESSASESEFNDGYDEDLMGNEADRLRLENLSEKERETEIFKRIERRDVMRTRWEIERKLKLAKKANRARDEVAGEAARPKKVERKPKESNKQNVASIKSPSVSIVNASVQQLPPTQPQATPQKPVVQLPKFVPPLDKSMFEPMDFNDSGDDHESHEYFDPKERSKERKKNVEMNRTDDKRSSAMAMLKAKREGKQKRGEWVCI